MKAGNLMRAMQKDKITVQRLNWAEHPELARAKELLQTHAYTCVVCGKGDVLVSGLRGVSPLLKWIEDGKDLNGYCAADKVVGKAAALLFVFVGIRAVYAPVMSRAAIAVLTAHAIPFACDARAAQIMNRAATGICPMERAVAEISDPGSALKAICRTRAKLQSADKPNYSV